MKGIDKEIFGKRLYECRKEKGFSQKQVAKVAGVEVNAYGQWERGRRTYQKPETLNALADYLDTTPAYLLGNTDDKRRPQTESADRVKESGEAVEKENYWGSISEAYNSLKADSRLIVENMIRKLVIADRAQE